MTTLIDMRRLRLALVEDDRSLRTFRDNYEAVKAEVSKEAFDGGMISGKNAEERDRNLTVYLESHADYKAARAMWRDAEWQRDRTTALLEAAKDERRAQEWQIRAKLADGLFRQQVQSDDDDPAVDTAFDDTADVSYQGISGKLASQHTWTNPETGEIHSRDGNYRPSDDAFDDFDEPTYDNFKW